LQPTFQKGIDIMQDELNYILRQSRTQEMLEKVADEKPESAICVGITQGKVFYTITHLDAVEAVGVLEITKGSILEDYLKGTYGTSH
jgi:hypothetical protein